MDIMPLVETSMVILAPYLKKGAEGFVSGAGKAAFETAAGFLKKVAGLFRGDEKAEKVTAGYEQDPELYSGALKTLIERKAGSDAHFAAALEKLVNEAQSHVAVDQVVKTGETLVGVGNADVSRGSLKVTQDATDVDSVTGINDLKIR